MTSPAPAEEPAGRRPFRGRRQVASLGLWFCGIPPWRWSLAWLLFAGGFALFATHVSKLTTPREPGERRRDHRADRRPVAPRRRARPAEVRQGRAPADQRRPPVRRPRSAAGGDRRRQAAVFLLRRHRPCRARHDRQCRGKRQMGASSTPMAASSWSPTTTTCRAACWKCDRLLGTAPARSPIRSSTRQLDDGGWMAKPGGAAGAVHRVLQISRRTGARRRSAALHTQGIALVDVTAAAAAEQIAHVVTFACAFPFFPAWCNQRRPVRQRTVPMLILRSLAFNIALLCQT